MFINKIMNIILVINIKFMLDYFKYDNFLNICEKPQ